MSLRELVAEEEPRTSRCNPRHVHQGGRSRCDFLRAGGGRSGAVLLERTAYVGREGPCAAYVGGKGNGAVFG